MPKIQQIDVQMVVITLPPPDRRLHAHAKGSWRAKAAPTLRLRVIACNEARRLAGGLSWPAARLRYRFLFADRRRRDAANAIQAMKPAVDGVVDAGLIPDDDWQHLTIDGVHCAVDRDNPRTELVFYAWSGKEHS